MKVLSIYQAGSRGWGKRIDSYIRDNRPAEWSLDSYLMPSPEVFPLIVDEIDGFLPESLPPADLVLVLSESVGLSQLSFELADLAEAKAVIVPIDDRRWLPEGLENQLKIRFVEAGISHVFPEPFCSLGVKETGNPYIDTFSLCFGRAIVSLEVQEGIIRKAEVGKGCPCGNTCFILERLIGTRVMHADKKAGLYHQYFPCLASVELIHISAHITETVIKKAVSKI